MKGKRYIAKQKPVLRQQAEKLLKELESKKFADWYQGAQGRFTKYICADPDAPSKEAILKELEGMINVQN